MSMTPAGMMAKVSGDMGRFSNQATPSVKPAEKNTALNYPGLDAKATQDETKQITDPILDYGSVRHAAIVGHFKKHWETNKYAKMVTDRRLLKCLRAARGEYSTFEIAEIAATGASASIYMKITSVKCAALASWLEEILLTPGNRPCGLEPRHLPQLPKPIKDLIEKQAGMQSRQMMTDAAKNGQGTMDPESFAILFQNIQDELESKVKHEYKRRATQAAQKMEDTVFQQMDNGNFDKAFRSFIENFSRYPTAFLKGPFQKRVKNLSWGPDWRPIVESNPVLWWAAPSPFDCYPAPLARSAQEGVFIERMRLTYSDLFDCIGVEGYDEEAIRWALSTHQGGLLKNWIWTDAERALLEHDATFNWFCQDNLIDALHCWGSIEGIELIRWGVTGDIDEEKRYEVDAIMIANRLVKLSINDDPLGRRPYRSASYEENPDSIWGMNAVPELCEASQEACNSAARAIINNSQIASGPQVWVDVDRLPPGDPITKLYPWKIWQFNRPDPGQTGVAATPMAFWQPNMVVGELWTIFKNFMDVSDDTTGIPRYSYGDEQVGGAGQTKGGLSMLMGAAARRVRRAIGAIDFGVLAETVFDTFVWCMRHVDDPQIKGDCVVVPKGSAALLIKEQMQEGRQTALQVVLQNQIVQILVGARGVGELIRDWFKGLHLPDVMPDGPEFDQAIARVEQMWSNPAPPVQMQVAQANNQGKQAIEAAKTKKDLMLKTMEHPDQAGLLMNILTMQQGNAQTQQGPGAGDPSPQQ